MIDALSVAVLAIAFGWSAIRVATGRTND